MKALSPAAARAALVAAARGPPAPAPAMKGMKAMKVMKAMKAPAPAKAMKEPLSLLVREHFQAIKESGKILHRNTQNTSGSTYFVEA